MQTLFGTYTIATLPAPATVLPGTLAFTTDQGLLTSASLSNSTFKSDLWVPAPQKPGANAIPFISEPTGSMANNGVFTRGTAMPTTYANAWSSFAAGAIFSGSAAGWYFTQSTSATAGTVFNNPYVSGTPTIPATPTPFVTTGPGAYTGVTGAVIGPQITIPAGMPGPNGVIRTSLLSSVPQTLNNKTISYAIGGVALGGRILNQTTQFGSAQIWTTYNRGAGSNVTPNGGSLSGLSDQGAALVYSSINFANAQTWSLTATLAVATEFIVIEGYLIEVFPG